MALDTIPTPEAIRAALDDNTAMRARDLADKLGIREAQLVAARAGQGVTRLEPHPDGIIGAACTLGEIMALTRNESCVSEVVGEYGNYTSGTHAALALNEPIDMRIFPMRWGSAFAVETPIKDGIRRSLQVFDQAGDAVHKIFLRGEASLPAWTRAVETLRHADQSDSLAVEARMAPEGARMNPAKVDDLRDAWRQMTDTHEFYMMVRKLKMNRLGAYRISGAPFVRQLAVESVDQMLTTARDSSTGIMSFVGNRGCIQIFSGPIGTLKQVGPWQNILDPGFNLHLRTDHIAEVWAVDKPTNRGGAAVSVEAFDTEGNLIIQFFGISREGRDTREEWKKIVAGLPDVKSIEVA